MITETYATFAKGDVVKAAMDTRYLKSGETYTIDRFSQHDEITSRVYWVIDAKGGIWSVRNGHITLAPVNA